MHRTVLRGIEKNIKVIAVQYNTVHNIPVHSSIVRFSTVHL